ncbi:hypothetical protein SKC41_15505 [Mycobacterium sp. 050128]|uniref:hypothetical protein n=1 Tax=Mycobacterium sp. 050128 TaxID=3096112 RepID=UPI002ED80349
MTPALSELSNTTTGYASADKLRRSVDRLKSVVRQNIEESSASGLLDNAAGTSATELAYNRGNLPEEQKVAQRIIEQHARLLRSALRRPDIESTERTAPPDFPIMGMQKWEGRVLDVDDDLISVELVPSGEGPVVTADFARHRLDEEDVRPGDVVYVTARTIRGWGGPTYTSSIRLRRLGKWTEAEIADQAQRAKEEVKELAAYIE